MSPHHCKQHGEPYTVCPDCACEYCERYWRRCPRCLEKQFGHGSPEVRDAIIEREIFRYDLASLHEPRVTLIDNDIGRRSDLPRLSYVVIPQRRR